MLFARGEPIVITYRFRFPGQRKASVSVRLRRDTLRVIPQSDGKPPAWCRLESEQCPNCPLAPLEHPFCPVAESLHSVVERFREIISYKRVEVVVTSGRRQIHRMATAAEALASLMGIYMAGSGCPILDRLRPMLLTHMPFASASETFYRSFATHLLRQFFVQRAHGVPDWSLAGLERSSEDIQIVNRAFAKRLGTAGTADAVLNALAQLDTFANLISEPLLTAELERIRTLFETPAV